MQSVDSLHFPQTPQDRALRGGKHTGTTLRPSSSVYTMLEPDKRAKTSFPNTESETFRDPKWFGGASVVVYDPVFVE